MLINEHVREQRMVENVEENFMMMGDSVNRNFIMMGKNTHEKKHYGW